MLDEEGARNLFKQVDSLWIQPEIEGRRAAKRLPENFRIRQCLIRLPLHSPPIVEFNAEISWVVRAKVAPPESINVGDPVYIENIQEITAVQPPEFDGTRVAFLYLYWNGTSYHIAFDFSPNVRSEPADEICSDSWNIGSVLADSIQSLVLEKTIFIHDKFQELLSKFGLCAAPALLPYPLGEIAMKLREGSADKASRLLVSHCHHKFLSTLTAKWWRIAPFLARKTLIEDALSAHREGKYSLSIHALLPQVEGVITDWVLSQVTEDELPWRSESKTKKFGNLVLPDNPTPYVYKRIVESAIDFINRGPVQETFRRWSATIEESFPNRHVVAHGRYEESLFTEENSIKLLLLLDTVCHIVSVQQGEDDDKGSV